MAGFGADGVPGRRSGAPSAGPHGRTASGGPPIPTATLKLTDDYIAEAMERRRRQHRGSSGWLLLRLLSAVVLALIALELLQQARAAIALAVAVIGLLVVLAPRLRDWGVRRSFLKSPALDDGVALEFTESGVYHRSRLGEGRTDWGAYTAAAHFRDGFLLSQGAAFVQWIPFASLGGPAEAEELAALLRAKIEEHRYVDAEARDAGDGEGADGESGRGDA